MDKRQTLKALFEGSPKEAEEALRNIRECWEQGEQSKKAFEENLTPLEQARYNDIYSKLMFRGSDISFENLTDNELEELEDITSKLE
jgi:hypothetical protein